MYGLITLINRVFTAPCVVAVPFSSLSLLYLVFSSWISYCCMFTFDMFPLFQALFDAVAWWVPHKKKKNFFLDNFLIFTARTLLSSLIFLQFRRSVSVRIVERKKLKFLASTNFMENILRQIKLVTDNDYCNHAFI